MVKVVGPLFSIGASGTLGKAITYKKGIEGQRVERVPRPHFRETPAQLSHRELFSYGMSFWKSLNAGVKDYYNVVAEPQHMTGYNYILKSYLLRKPLGPLPWIFFDNFENADNWQAISGSWGIVAEQEPVYWKPRLWARMPCVLEHQGKLRMLYCDNLHQTYPAGWPIPFRPYFAEAAGIGQEMTEIGQAWVDPVGESNGNGYWPNCFRFHDGVYYATYTMGNPQMDIRLAYGNTPDSMQPYAGNPILTAAMVSPNWVGGVTGLMDACLVFHNGGCLLFYTAFGLVYPPHGGAEQGLATAATPFGPFVDQGPLIQDPASPWWFEDADYVFDGVDTWHCLYSIGTEIRRCTISDAQFPGTWGQWAMQGPINLQRYAWDWGNMSSPEFIVIGGEVYMFFYGTALDDHVVANRWQDNIVGYAKTVNYEDYRPQHMDNQYQQGSLVDGLYVSVLKDRTYGDMEIVGRVTVHQQGLVRMAGVIFRYQDADNYYYALVDVNGGDGKARLYKRVAGVSTEIGGRPVAFQDMEDYDKDFYKVVEGWEYLIKVRFWTEGGHENMKVSMGRPKGDYTEVFSCYDDSLPATGAVGLITDKAKALFNDFGVRPFLS